MVFVITNRHFLEPFIFKTEMFIIPEFLEKLRWILIRYKIIIQNNVKLEKFEGEHSGNIIKTYDNLNVVFTNCSISYSY